MSKLCLFVLAISTLGPTTVAAQTGQRDGKGFLNVSVGYQPRVQDGSDSQSLSLYGEQGRVDARYGIRTGVLFDASGGVRVWRSLGVGLGVSWTASSRSGQVAASVPHPLFTGRNRTANTAIADLNHTEVGVHVLAVWVVPVSDKVEVLLSGGPSIFNVRQDVLARVDIVETAPMPFDQVSVVPVTTEHRKTVTGANVGAEVTYMITRHLGGGFFLRYAGAKANLNLASGSLDVGGFQTGGGLRVRF